jgi:hypothetical protein
MTMDRTGRLETQCEGRTRPATAALVRIVEEHRSSAMSMRSMTSQVPSPACGDCLPRPRGVKTARHALGAWLSSRRVTDGGPIGSSIRAQQRSRAPALLRPTPLPRSGDCERYEGPLQRLHLVFHLWVTNNDRSPI